MSRITWSTAAKGERVVPCVLLHGLPAILVPEGMPTISALSITSPPSLWWPGNTLGNWTANVKPWMDLSQGFEFSERAIPTQPTMLEVSEIEFNFSDVGTGATAFFSQRDSAKATFITQDVAPSDAVINVISTAAFPSAGTLYLERGSRRAAMRMVHHMAERLALGLTDELGAPARARWPLDQAQAQTLLRVFHIALDGLLLALDFFDAQVPKGKNNGT